MIDKRIFRVALDVPLNRLFDYTSNGFAAQIGTRVVVPFGGRQLVGVVLEILNESEVPADKLKPIAHAFDEVVLDAATLKLLHFCAEYYHYPLGQTLIAALPLRLRQVKPAVTRKMFIYALNAYANVAEIPKKQIVLHRIAHALQASQTLNAQALAALSPGWRKAIAMLKDKGWIIETEVPAVKPSLHTSNIEPILTDEQQRAVEAISASDGFKTWLLHGITGSGKTEVYIRLLQHVLANAQAQVLILVPEINLTPQLEARFRARLSQFSLVTLHSSLSESERLQHWQAASQAAARIVIGTRLSVFTPMPHLKMLIIDEEHDASYKQQDGMRYHARDVAIMRAKQLGIPIVLGSATPSLETWYQAQKGQYGLLSLMQRAVSQATLPKIHCIDTVKTPVHDGLSPVLIKAMRERLQRGEQSLLFINRRGYAPVLHCNACQWVAPCQRCSARLVVHLSQRRLRCHHCGAEQRIPVQCPSCGNADLSPVGVATQRLQETLMHLLPEARIARVDRDSVRSKDSLTHILKQVQDKQIDILVGTQMLAKGHDFPYLTLVGVLDTDTALFSPDFRAAERLFAQLMQVSGRAGRAELAGEVLIQTAFPHHPLFEALRTQDYSAFADALLQERVIMQFPPASYFALLKAEAGEFKPVQDFLLNAANLAHALAHEVTVYDLVRPQLERLKGLERAYLLIQAPRRMMLQRFLKAWLPPLREDKRASKIRWSLDIDPLEF